MRSPGDMAEVRGHPGQSAVHCSGAHHPQNSGETTGRPTTMAFARWASGSTARVRDARSGVGYPNRRGSSHPTRQKGRGLGHADLTEG